MYAVGMCVDENYLVPALVTLTSLADSTPQRDRADVAVRVLTTNVANGHTATMAAFVKRLGFGSFEMRREPLGSHRYIIYGSYISETTYLRFNLAPDFVSRPYVVYLDADILVLGDVAEPLWELGPTEIGLVRDPINHTVGHGSALPGVTQRWPQFHGRPYFNAGAIWFPTQLLPDVKRRVDRIMARDLRHIYFNDQDALNLWALHSDTAVRQLDCTFNTFELDRFHEVCNWARRPAARQRPQRNPTVVHFIGASKPWHKTCPSTDGTRVYRSYLQEVLRQLRRIGDLTIDLPPAPRRSLKSYRRQGMARTRPGAWPDVETQRRPP